MKENDYIPIPCRTYSELELAILHRRRLHLRWRDEDRLDHIETLRPLDLVTRTHQEFLVAEGADGRRYEIRLDRIGAFEAL